MRGRGWRAVFCFFSAILWRVPRFLGDRFSVPHGDSVRHPFGIRGRAEPAGACAPPTGGEGTILSHNLLNYVNFIPRKVAAKSFPPMPGVTRQTVLCTTPFSFGMKKLGKSILWHTVCINKKAGACSRLSVYAVFIRSAAILAYSGESSMPTHLLPVAFAARAVEPPPRKGSSTVPPSGTTPMSSAMS